MAELFADPSFWKNNGQQPAGNYTGNPEIDRELDKMPEDERQAAIAEITAPPTGEEVADMIQSKLAVGEVANVSREEYRLYKAYQKTKETPIIEAIGMGAEMVWNDLQKAAGSMYDKPVDSIVKLTPSAIEAFSQGTRGLYGMLAESQDPNSTLFRIKNAIFAGGDEDAEYEQFMQALDFNAKSTRLMQGKETIVMDKDLINQEVTQAMVYVADPSLFIPFEGVALKGAQLIGMAEGLAKASARASAIKQMVIGGTLKWGVGAPIEVVGGATRATIDAAVDRGSRAISAVTGMQTGEIATAARMTGLSTIAADAAGMSVPFGTGISEAYVGASTLRGVGEAVGAVGEQMMRGERGVLSYAQQALRESAEGGAKLTPQAENLLKAIDFVDPMFSYTADVTKGVTQGAVIGGGLGYLGGGEEGMAQGIGAGAVLGGVGAGFGRIYADISGATKTDRMRITTDLGLNILAETNPTQAKDYATLRAVAQVKGVNVDGYISGLLRIAPDLDTYFKGSVDHAAEISARGFNPDTYDGSFVDQNGRRLFSMPEFEKAEGFVIDKAKDGRVTFGINLDNLKKNTVPHEAFHTIFRSVVMEPEFQRRMTESVLGSFDKDGKQISAPKVSQAEAVAFFDRYLKALHKGDKLTEQRALLKQALDEYYRDGQTKVMAEDGKTPYLANLSEEFGAYYFTQFIEGKPLDYLFLGGELGGVRGIMQSVQDGWLDYWDGRAKRVEPKFDMNNPDGIDYAFKPKGGKRVRVGAIDYLMQDLVRAASQRRQDGSINLSKMSRDTREQFLRSQGLDGVGETRAKPFRVPTTRGQDSVKIYNKTFGPQVHAAILAMPENLRPKVDGNGDFTGPLSKEVIEQIVSTGHVSREMGNKIQVLQDMANGKMQSNIAEMGYVGWSMQTDVGPNPPRVYGGEVPYKRRKVMVLGVESKIGQKGMSFTAKTLDWQVIETRANNLWSDTRVRNMWGDDRGVFVQDFFRYLTNASKTDAEGRVPSGKLWAENGDAKRDVMQQMAGIPKQAGETYAHPPIAEIHEDILNSVMNLTVNRMSDVRVTGDNVFFDAEKAAPFIRVNMKVADMPYEETPNGKVFTDKQSGFRFTQTAKGVTAFDRHGEFIGSYTNLEDAGKFAKRVYERQQAAMKEVAMQVTDEASRGITYKSKAQMVQDNASVSIKSWLESKISAESSNTNKDYIIESLQRAIGHLVDEQGNPNKALIDAVNAGFSESQNALAQANILKKLKAGEAVDAKELAAAFHPKALDSNGNFTGKTAKLSSEGILFAVESPDGKTEIKLDRHIETLQIELNKAIISSSDAWEAMFPRTFRSRLLDKVQKLQEQNPNLSYQGLIKKLLRDSSNGYRFYAEAEAIGLLDFLRSKIDPAQRIEKQRDAQGNWTGGIKTTDKPFADSKIRGGRTDVPIDIEEVSNWIYNKELTLQVDDGARADLGGTSSFVHEGTTLGYNETAIRMPQEYAHGISGHYGPDVVVHHRSTVRTDVNGEQVRFVDEIQANNAKPEEITESHFRRSKEIIELLDAGKILSRVRSIENKETALWDKHKIRDVDSIRHTITQTGEMHDKDAVGLVKQANMFNELLEGYVELYRNNNAKYIKDIEDATSKGGTYEIKRGRPTEVEQHWANVLELQKSGEFLKHLESFRITTKDPIKILEFFEKIKDEEKGRHKITKREIPSIEETKIKESVEPIDQIRRASQYVYEDISYSSATTMEAKEGKIIGLSSINRDMPYIPTSIGRNITVQNANVIGGKEFNNRIIKVLFEDPAIKESIKQSDKNKAEMDKLKKILGDMSHLKFDADEDLTFQRLSEVRSLAKTNIKKYNQVKGRKPFPLEEISEWSAVAIKDIITKSIQDGIDLITITHPDDSPVKSNMAKEARQDDYGRIFPQVAQKIVGKYGIEVKQRNELPALTEAQMKDDGFYKQMAEARNKAVADAMEVFKETQGQGESPDVISELSRQFSRTAEDLHKEFYDETKSEWLNGWSDKVLDLLIQVKSPKLKSALVDVKGAVASEAYAFQTVKQSLYSQYDPSVVAIDRGMSFRLNKEIKEAVMQGELRTAYKPAEAGEEGGRRYTPEQLDGAFIGRYAAENPETIKGLTIKAKMDYSKSDPYNEYSGPKEVVLQLFKDGKQIGKFNSTQFKMIGASSGELRITELDQMNKGYGKLLMSEMAERLKHTGTRWFEGMIVDEARRPIAIREEIIGNTHKKVYNIRTRKHEWIPLKQELKPWQTINAFPEVGNRLDPNAWYKPEEGDAPKSAVPTPEERKAKLDRFNEIMAIVFKKTGGKTSALSQRDAIEYASLMREAQGIQFELRAGRRIKLETIPSMESRKSAIPSDIVKVASDELASNRTVHDIIGEVAQGVYLNQDTAVDDVFNGKNKDVTPQEFYAAFEKTRQALRQKFGDTIELYRAQGKQRDKYTQLWASSKEIAGNYGSNIEKRSIPIDNILALNVGLRGGYEEFFIGKKPTEGDAPLRVNFSPDEVKKNLRSLQSAIDRQSDKDKVPAGIKKGVGRLIQAIERQRKEDVKSMPQAVKEGFKALADAVDAQADMDKVPAGVRKGLRLLFEAAQYEDLKPQKAMPKPTASEEQLASGIEALGRAVGVKGQVRRQPRPQAKPAPTAAMPQAQPAPSPVPVRPTPEPTSTAWMSWTQEKTETGGFIKNALGYVIVVNKGRFKVYNPAKALLGIYEDEESAKRRVLKDMPRR